MCNYTYPSTHEKAGKHQHHAAEESVVEVSEVTETPVVETLVIETPAEETPVAIQPSSVKVVVRKSPASREMISECKKFLNGAGCKWVCDEFMLDKQTKKYNHPVNRETTIIRVEDGKPRLFFWIYNRNTARDFSKFVGLELRAEVHEVITSPGVSFFYDIDLKLDDFEQDEVTEFYDTTDFEKIGDKIAHVYINAIKISLSEHGIDCDNELSMFDWMYTSRNRKVDDQFKISLHIITNLMLTLPQCKALVEDIRDATIPQNPEPLDISDEMISMLQEAIDTQPYRRHGSLALPYSTKNGHMHRIIRGFGFPDESYFITHYTSTMQEVDMGKYDVRETSVTTSEASDGFIKEAIDSACRIPYITSFDIQNLKGNGAVRRPQRIRGSLCPMCPDKKDGHQQDNTLMVIFNEDLGYASWKCDRSKDKPIVFYRREHDDEEADEEDLEAFSTKMDQKQLVDQKILGLLMCLKEKRFTTSSKRSPLFELAAVIRDHADLERNVAFATFNKACMNKMGEDYKESIVETAFTMPETRSR